MVEDLHARLGQPIPQSLNVAECLLRPVDRLVTPGPNELLPNAPQAHAGESHDPEEVFVGAPGWHSLGRLPCL